jgi:hypothetical protein
VRAEKDGFGPQVRRLMVERDEEVNFLLQRLDAPGDIRGVYKLTFTGSPSCTLPPEAMQRNYGARIDGRQGEILVELTGPGFVDYWAGLDQRAPGPGRRQGGRSWVSWGGSAVGCS